jgi:hypothetical protein
MKKKPEKSKKNKIDKKIKPFDICKIFPTFIDECVRYYSMGISYQDIAKLFFVTPEFLLDYIKTSEELSMKMERARIENILDVAETNLELAKTHDPRCFPDRKFYLENVGHFSNNWRIIEGMKETLPVNEIKITASTDAEAMREYERIMKE